VLCSLIDTTDVLEVLTASIIRILALMMEAISSSETLVNTHQTTRHNSPHSSLWEPEISLYQSYHSLRLNEGICSLCQVCFWAVWYNSNGPDLHLGCTLLLFIQTKLFVFSFSPGKCWDSICHISHNCWLSNPIQSLLIIVWSSNFKLYNHCNWNYANTNWISAAGSLYTCVRWKKMYK
jgi:hypothetical protein